MKREGGSNRDKVDKAERDAQEEREKVRPRLRRVGAERLIRLEAEKTRWGKGRRRSCGLRWAA